MTTAAAVKETLIERAMLMRRFAGCEHERLRVDGHPLAIRCFDCGWRQDEYGRETRVVTTQEESAARFEALLMVD
jgi:hypothetical protein